METVFHDLVTRERRSDIGKGKENGRTFREFGGFSGVREDYLFVGLRGSFDRFGKRIGVRLAAKDRNFLSRCPSVIIGFRKVRLTVALAGSFRC